MEIFCEQRERLSIMIHTLKYKNTYQPCLVRFHKMQWFKIQIEGIDRYALKLFIGGYGALGIQATVGRQINLFV